MIYNICVVKNRFNKQINLNKYTTEWFKKYTPLEIEYNVIETDFDVTTEAVSNGTFSGVICGGDIVQKLRTVIPENKYNAIVFIYGNELDGIRVNVCNGSGRAFNLYHDTELIQLIQYKDNGRTLNHEMFHGFFAKINRLGIPTYDNMDTYLNDWDIEINNKIDTNREIALNNIAPYWDKICSFKTLSTNSSAIVKPLSTWKYFKPEEFTNAQKTHTVSELKPEFVDLLDKMRGECGFPWKIVSGYRTVAENNQLLDSVSDSAHTTREAVDIFCTDSSKRDKILEVIVKNGIKRKGIASTFIHIDVSKTLPQEKTWIYN